MISFPVKRKRDGLEENIDGEVDADFADDNDAAAPNLPMPVKKPFQPKKNKSSSKSRTNEVTTFLKKFTADQKDAEEKRLERLDRMHEQKMAVFERFLNIMERK